MVISTKGSEKASYSVRVKPDIINRLKHLAVDEMKSASELIEEGMFLILEKRETLKQQ